MRSRKGACCLAGGLCSADEVLVIGGKDDYPAAVAAINALTGGKGAWGMMDCLAGDAPINVSHRCDS